jgi:hypothetical protein
MLMLIVMLINKHYLNAMFCLVIITLIYCHLGSFASKPVDCVMEIDHSII